MMEWYFVQMNVSEPGAVRARGGPIDARHAARTRPYTSRPSGTASKLFGGKLLPVEAGAYSYLWYLNAAASFCYTITSYRWENTLNVIFTHLETVYVVTQYLNWSTDDMSRRRSKQVYYDGRLGLKVTTAYLALEQPSESTARCRMVGAGARGALSPRRPAPAPQPFLYQPWLWVRS